MFRWNDSPSRALALGYRGEIDAFSVELSFARSMMLGMEASYGASKRFPYNPSHSLLSVSHVG